MLLGVTCGRLQLCAVMRGYARTLAALSAAVFLLVFAVMCSYVRLCAVMCGYVRLCAVCLRPPPGSSWVPLKLGNTTDFLTVAFNLGFRQQKLTEETAEAHVGNKEFSQRLLTKWPLRQQKLASDRRGSIPLNPPRIKPCMSHWFGT